MRLQSLVGGVSRSAESVEDAEPEVSSPPGVSLAAISDRKILLVVPSPGVGTKAVPKLDGTAMPGWRLLRGGGEFEWARECGRW